MKFMFTTCLQQLKIYGWFIYCSPVLLQRMFLSFVCFQCGGRILKTQEGGGGGGYDIKICFLATIIVNLF